jgi:hypothetical protein
MAKSRSDDEDFEDDARPRRRPAQRSDEEDDDRPARRSRRRDEEEDDEDDRPRRRRSREREGPGMIPYRNVMALVAYYCGFGSLIAILGSIAIIMIMVDRTNPLVILVLMYGVGGLLGLMGIIFGIVGLSYAGKHPKARGTGHAITGIIMGSLEVLGLIGIFLVGVAMFQH